jgi:hypothetical protein
LESCLGWIPAPEAGGVASEPEIAAARHLFVMSKLQFAALRRLQPGRPRQFATELNRVGLPQLYMAWKAARSIGVPAA